MYHYDISGRLSDIDFAVTGYDVQLNRHRDHYCYNVYIEDRNISQISRQAKMAAYNVCIQYSAIILILANTTLYDLVQYYLSVY